jgi:hypothetical protein
VNAEAIGQTGLNCAHQRVSSVTRAENYAAKLVERFYRNAFRGAHVSGSSNELG